MNNNNDRFLSAYNRLDNYLQSIVKTKGHVNMISYLERVLPEKQAAECKTIRQFKNSIESHGVNPGYKKPNVPEEWIKWLLNELEWCKTHRNTISPKLQRLLDKKNHSSNDQHLTPPSKYRTTDNSKDEILTCKGCGSKFYFTVGEQRYYKQKGLNLPSYCSNCREKKKQKQYKSATYTPKACTTCYFFEILSDIWYNGEFYSEFSTCSRCNRPLINDAPCKYWTKGY